MTWKFDQPPNGACIASQAVFAGAPVLVVTHYQDDHSWAFTDGGPNDPAKAMVVAMSEVLEACPDIGQVADLPPGWSARRTSTGQPWSRHPDADESSD